MTPGMTGMDVTFDTYPYEWASTRLLIQLPSGCRRVGRWPLKERLADRGVRDQLRAELAARGAAYTGSAGWADLRLGAFTRPENLRWESRTLAEVMEETGRDAVDAICDLLLAENLGRRAGDQRAVERDPPPLRAPPGRHGRHRLHLPGREAVAADLRLLPAGSSASSCATSSSSPSKRRSAR